MRIRARSSHPLTPHLKTETSAGSALRADGNEEHHERLCVLVT
jgi:hypothetical protein